MIDIFKENILNIFYSVGKKDRFELNILFNLGNTCLLFDSSRFAISNIGLINNNSFNWKEIDYPEIRNGISIIGIKEDENTSYFIQFSNKDIFFIFINIDGMENLSQDFEIVRKKDIMRYNEIYEYMNEKWVEEIKIPPHPPALPSVPLG